MSDKCNMVHHLICCHLDNKWTSWFSLICTYCECQPSFRFVYPTYFEVACAEEFYWWQYVPSYLVTLVSPFRKAVIMGSAPELLFFGGEREQFLILVCQYFSLIYIITLADCHAFFEVTCISYFTLKMVFYFRLGKKFHSCEVCIMCNCSCVYSLDTVLRVLRICTVISCLIIRPT